MIQYVNSFEEAKNFPVMFNTSEIFLDANQDKFYCKSVDQMGKASMSTYEFRQIENEKPLTSADFVPREQFDALNAKIDNLMMLLSSSQPTPPKAEVAQPITNTSLRKNGNNSKEVTSDGK